MVEVKVTFVGVIQRIVGCREELVSLPEGTTLRGLLQDLIARHGSRLEEHLLENGDLAALATVLVNGRNDLSQGGLDAKLSNGLDNHVEIVVLGPPLMGG